MLEDKIKTVFADMVVLKDPQRSEFFSNLSIPSYMRDWLVMKFSDRSGQIDYDSILSYIKKVIPDKEAYQVIKYRLTQGTTERILARVRLEVNLKRNQVQFELPDFGGSRGGAAGIVSQEVMNDQADELLKESENWGIIDLCLGSTLNTNLEETNSEKGNSRLLNKLLKKSVETNESDIWYKPNEVYLTNFKAFCPYKVDLEFFKNARKNFTTSEWIDVIISSIDFNPDGYEDNPQKLPAEEVKLILLRRLLPFIEKRVNLIELAPKGTGKSYIFEKISKRGWLITGGTVSRASLIYDNARKTGGLLTRFDFVGFDEVQSITFEQPGQIQQALKQYMEFGEIKGFDAQLSSDAGVIVLGNINAEKFDINQNMVEQISEVFAESATLDRFHGFIPGWYIPRLKQQHIAKGWAINTEYFAEVLHAMRDDLSYSAIVDSCLTMKGDKRDSTAIKRLCTAFLKLLFPQVRTKYDLDKEEFIKYCVNPAVEMRSVIKKQLCIIDPKEFDVPGMNVLPTIEYNWN